MRRINIILCMVLIGLVMLQSGCTAVAADLMAGVEAAEWPESPAPPSETFSKNTMEYSWNLLQESANNPGNILISPASVYLALAMTLNGADGETKTAMLEALAAEGMEMQDLNQACRDWITLLEKDSEAVHMSIANSIWFRTGFSADKKFLQTNADFFAAGAQMLDFSKPEAVVAINSWVKTSTNGTIDKILERIGPAAVMYLINTIYFKSNWKTQFQLHFTFDGSFAAPDGPADVKFMRRTGEMAYLEGLGASGVLLPYLDEQYAFFALLPASGTSPRQFIASSEGTALTDLIQNARNARVDLSMPRFEVKYEDSLVNELQNMGMSIAFASGQADFSLMSSSRAKDLYISEVKHKTFCKINEVGTEAAAATLVEISKTAVPGGDVELVLNRPFIYGILDMTSGLPIFIGVMENPA
jgi:serine protease inhibitor